MTSARVLVMAKAPVAGVAKTRLGHEIGMERAADLAAAALLDTIAACAGFESRHLALAGDLAEAARGAELVAALDGWVVFEQCGSSFGERLAHAHGQVAERGPGGVVQVGMDTPQLSPELLASVAGALEDGNDAVIGPAIDGGWWVLGLADPHHGAALLEVPMSVPETYDCTVAALAGRGLAVLPTAVLCDVDTVADAARVAAEAPHTRFAHTWVATVASLEASR